MKASILVVGLCLMLANVEAKNGRSMARDKDWDETSIFLDAAEGNANGVGSAADDCKEYADWNHFGAFAVEYTVEVDPSPTGYAVSVAMRQGAALNEGTIRGIGFNLVGVTCADISVSGPGAVTIDECFEDSSNCGTQCNFVSDVQNVFDVSFGVLTTPTTDDITTVTFNVASTQPLEMFGSLAVRALKVGLSISDRSGASKDMATDLVPCMYDTGLRLTSTVWGDPHFEIFGDRLDNQKITPAENFQIAGYWQLLDVPEKDLAVEIRTALCRIGKTCVREVAFSHGGNVITYSEARGFRLDNVGVRFHDLQAGQLTEGINVEYLACDSHRPLGIFIIRFERLRASFVVRTGHRAEDGLKIDGSIPDQWTTETSGIRGMWGTGVFDHEFVASDGTDIGTVVNNQELTDDFFFSYQIQEADSVIVATKLLETH